MAMTASRFPPEVDAISTTADVSAPYDAAPSADGHTIYFTASGAQGAAVYKAAASGGRAAVLFAGAPFVFPSALAITGDDRTLFVSDPAAEQDTGPLGGIYAVALPGGTPALVAGSSGFLAAGLAVAGAKLYVAGTSPDGVAGLYAADVSGGSLAAIATGPAFADPSGIAVRSDEIYVADGGNGSARIVRVAGGKATVVLRDLAVGYPAGVALSPDQSSLYVSALDPQAGGDTVLRFDLASSHVDSTSAGIISSSTRPVCTAPPMPPSTRGPTRQPMTRAPYWCSATSNEGKMVMNYRYLLGTAAALAVAGASPGAYA